MAETQADVISTRVIRAIMGYGNLVLPFVLIILVWLPILADDHQQSTMSEYIYTGARPAFTGALFSIAVLYAAYIGYPGRAKGIGPLRFSDRTVAYVGMLAAATTAFFPANTCVDGITTNPWSSLPLLDPGSVHSFAAAWLFGVGGWLLFFHFTMNDGTRDTAKKRRDNIYYICGGAIFGFMALFAIWRMIDGDAVCKYENQLSPYFWIEAAMTVLFAVGWIVKSQALPKWFR